MKKIIKQGIINLHKIQFLLINYLNIERIKNIYNNKQNTFFKYPFN